MERPFAYFHYEPFCIALHWCIGEGFPCEQTALPWLPRSCRISSKIRPHCLRSAVPAAVSPKVPRPLGTSKHCINAVIRLSAVNLAYLCSLLGCLRPSQTHKDVIQPSSKDQPSFSLQKEDQLPPAELHLINIPIPICSSARQSQRDELFKAFTKCRPLVYLRAGLLYCINKSIISKLISLPLLEQVLALAC